MNIDKDVQTTVESINNKAQVDTSKRLPLDSFCTMAKETIIPYPLMEKNRSKELGPTMNGLSGSMYHRDSSLGIPSEWTTTPYNNAFTCLQRIKVPTNFTKVYKKGWNRVHWVANGPFAQYDLACTINKL